MYRRLLLALLVAALVIMPSGLNHATAQQGTPDNSLPPHIIDVSPLPGAELLPSDTLTLYFDQAMNEPSVEKAISFSPALTGKFNWTDPQTLNFQPAAPWPIGQAYE